MHRATATKNTTLQHRAVITSVLTVALTVFSVIALLDTSAAKPIPRSPHQTNAQVVARYLPTLEFAATSATAQQQQSIHKNIDRVAGQQHIDAFIPDRTEQQVTTSETQNGDTFSL